MTGAATVDEGVVPIASHMAKGSGNASFNFAMLRDDRE
jgi:hypothetical protein